MADRRPDPWEQRTGESGPAYAAFIAYRDMGIERSTAKVAKQVSKSKTLMDRWSGRNSWVARVRAWDREEDRAHATTMRARRRTAEIRNLAVAGRMMSTAATALTSIDPSKLKPQDIARMVEVAAKLEASTLGMATERVALTGGDGSGPVQVDVSALTDEERHERLTALLRQGAERVRLWQEEAEAAG